MPTTEVAPRNVLGINGTQFTARPKGFYWVISTTDNGSELCDYWPRHDTIYFREEVNITPSTMLDLARFINNNLRHQNCRTPC